jgi:hypothetical protein
VSYSKNVGEVSARYRFIEAVFGKVLIREDADASEMVQHRFQVEVGLMTPGPGTP